MLGRKDKVGVGVLVAVGAVAALAWGTGASAQTTGAVNGNSQARAVAPGVRAEAATLMRMSRRLTLEVTEQRLEDVLKFIEDVSGAEMEVFWTEGSMVGLDKDHLVTVSIRNQAALSALEKILDKLRSTDAGECSWQLTRDGTLQVGPKERLNRYKRVEIYDINDLLVEIPRYDDAPQLDLQGILQQSGQGGGGGQSPFRDDDMNREVDTRTRQERAEQIQDLITSLVESEQWEVNGGSGGTIRYYQGTLIVRAPDYMHRQINGYPYWPSHSATMVGGRRYVSLGMDVGTSSLEQIKSFEVPGIVP